MRNTTSLHGAACASHRRGSLNKTICYRFLVCVDTYNTGKANKNPLDPMRKREKYVSYGGGYTHRCSLG